MELFVSFQNTLFHISSIFSKILLGFAYCSTSNHNNLHKIGNTKIVKTVITTPITAYLIVLIAGFIFSSFHHDKINNNHPHKIKTIENIHANNTNNDIAKRTKSQNVKLGQKIETFSPAAKVVLINIKLYIKN
jgi:hypothetical protein